MLVERELTDKILKCAYTVHTELGSGLLERTYEECLFYELQKIGLLVERQKELPLFYKDIKIDVGYKIDLLIENKVIIELKVIEQFSNVHIAQLLTYLRLSKCKIGYLMNFNVVSLKHGIRRYIL